MSEQQMYLGSKLIKAMPMTRQEYNDYRDWQLPEDEKHLANEPGYLVEYLDGGRANDDRHEGYISWSPQNVFDNSYKPVTGMSFGMAVEAMKQGFKCAREGWNGKGMWVIFNPGSGGEVFDMTPGSVYHKHGLERTEILPHFDMYTVNAHGRKAMAPGWSASQSDMDATDWVIVP
jgi:hypothetical protein